VLAGVDATGAIDGDAERQHETTPTAHRRERLEGRRRRRQQQGH
jgi:hypothetical protein